LAPNALFELILGKNAKKPHKTGILQPATRCRFKIALFLYALSARMVTEQTLRGTLKSE
jgi:hypothetical protein